MSCWRSWGPKLSWRRIQQWCGSGCLFCFVFLVDDDVPFFCGWKYIDSFLEWCYIPIQGCTGRQSFSEETVFSPTMDKKTTFCLKLLMLPKSAYFAIHLAFATHQRMFPFISKILRHNRVYVETNCFLSFRNFSASTAFTLSDICHPVSAWYLFSSMIFLFYFCFTTIHTL